MVNGTSLQESEINLQYEISSSAAIIYSIYKRSWESQEI